MSVTNCRRVRDLQFLRTAIELSLSSNLAWVIVWIGGIGAAPFFPRLEWHRSFVRLIYGSGTRVTATYPLDQIVWWPVMGMVLFAGLSVVSRFWDAKWILNNVAGFVALFALPLFYIWRDRTESVRLFDADRSAPGGLLLELVCALLVAGLYLYGKVQLRPSLAVFMVVLHFGVWEWAGTGFAFFRFLGALIDSVGLLSTDFVVLLLFQTCFPLVGVFSAIVWGLYVRRSRAAVLQ